MFSQVAVQVFKDEHVGPSRLRARTGVLSGKVLLSLPLGGNQEALEP